MTRVYTREECYESCLSYYRTLFLSSEGEASEICSEILQASPEEIIVFKGRSLKESATVSH